MNNLLNEILKEQAQASTQRSAAWFNARVGKFTASEFYKLLTQPQSKEARDRGELSETTKSYILSKLAEEMTGVEQSTNSIQTEWGIDNEVKAIALYEELHDCTVETAGFIPYGDYAGGSPDGICSINGLLEIKCPFNPENHVKNLLITDQNELYKVHKDYWWQLQFNMVITGLEEGMFISYDPRQSGKAIMALVPVKLQPSSKEIIDSTIEKAVSYKKMLEERLKNR